MTQTGVNDLYGYLTAAWPLVIRPIADDDFKRAKKRELYTTFIKYDDKVVMDAFRQWTDREPKFPTNSDIINEIEWTKVQSKVKASEGQLYQMPLIRSDGIEFIATHDGKSSFTWDEFKNLPQNKDHLDPDEWERRYRIRRKQVLGGSR